ncbi:permease [Segniliparus rugosus]|uniref:permease n=1 Tax=Segniliparus rugosus TaxID=286804 RepID=UPI0001F0410E|nr:permease [Segniliparus rugosus]
MRAQAGSVRPSSIWVFTVVLLVFIVFAEQVSDAFAAHPVLSAAATVFSGIFVQAVPFVALGVLVSALIAAFFPGDGLRRLLPRGEKARVLASGLAGVGLPACECASAPIASRLLASGAGRGAAIAFLLAAPAINPVVIAATLVAFPDRPQMALARFCASLLVAWLVGLAFLRRASDQDPLPEPAHEAGHAHGGGSRLDRFLAAAKADLLSSGSFLVLGAGFAALAHVLIPPAWLAALGGNLLSSVAAMTVLAVVLSVCSEADAFVAASFTALPSTAQLVFLVVSPMVDLKLVGMHVGMFGARLALRLDAVVLAVAVAVATTGGLLVFGAGR